MKKYIFLSFLFIVPMSVIAFLYVFGTNRFQIPIYYLLDSTQVNGAWKKTYHTIPAFQLINQEGKKFDSQSLKGKIYVADFFFTTCGNPNFCPKMSAELKRVQEIYKKNPEIQLVSFTVNPQTDTPEVLKKYAQKYKAMPDKWHFLTGDKNKIYDLAQQGFKLLAGSPTENITPDFIHTSRFVLVDKEGRIRGYYQGNDSQEVDRLILEIKILLYDYEKM
jgi:protein SCO1